MEKDTYLRLFICSSDSLIVYIIDNELVGLELDGQYVREYEYVYQLLANLFLDYSINQSLPHELFDSHKEKFEKFQSNSFCITGGIGNENILNKCLTTKMKIQSSNGKITVTFNSFAMLLGTIDETFVNSFDKTLQYTPEEALILLSNICLSSIDIWRFDPDAIKKEPKGNAIVMHHDIPSIRKFTISYFNKRRGLSRKFSQKALQIALYCIDYYAFLLEQVTSNKLSLEKILRLSGPQILTTYLSHIPHVQDFLRAKITLLLNNYNSLSKHQKIMYYTLLMLAIYDESIPEITDLVKMNKLIITDITHKLSKNFPEKLGIKTTWNEIYRKFLGRD